MRAPILASALLFSIACASEPAEEPARAVMPATDGCAGDPSEVPDDLRCTGLYADWAAKAVAPTARAFSPAAPLWSDGADKQRWVMLPEGSVIDATAIDDWKLPVGTKAWKEFAVAGRRVETRFMWKVRDDRWLQAAYVWSEDGASAVRGDGRDLLVAGAPYHVPKSTECNECHKGRRDRLLGFEAIDLALPGATGLTLDVLVAEKRIAPVPTRTTLAIADGLAAPALAHLHTNCGVSCHNASANATGGVTGLDLRLTWADLEGARPPASWASLATTLGVPAKTPEWVGQPRIAPGDPDASLLLTLLSTRGPGQMPKLGTNVVDEVAAQAIRSWIAAMPKP